MLNILPDRRNLSAFDVWSIFTSTRLHFKNTGYDAFRYCFRRSKPDRYFERGIYHYEKVAKVCGSTNAVLEYSVANVLSGKSFIFDAEVSLWHAWEARIQRMGYQFKTDTNILVEYAEEHEIGFDDLFVPNNPSDAPPLLKLMLSETIQSETVIALDCLLNFCNRVDRNPDPLGIISNTTSFIRKYRPFLSGLIDTEKCRQTVLKSFNTLNQTKYELSC